MMSFILPIKLIIMRILAFLIFFPKMNDQGRDLVSLKTQADAGSLVSDGHEVGIYSSPPCRSLI